MNIELGKSWGKKLQGRINRHRFEVGVLQDKPHFNPIQAGLFETPELKQFAGGPARKQTRVVGPLSIGEILVANMQRLNINILLRPFQEKSSALLKFTNSFLKYVCQYPGFNIRRVENLLQAVVRNPILKGEYGRNKPHTADAKGFDRHLIDTSQTFKNIKAKAKRV